MCFYLVCSLTKNERVNRFALSKLSRAVLFVIGFHSIHVNTALESSISHLSVNTAGIVSNHVGWADILLLCWLFSPSFVARAETCDTPLVGLVAQAMKCLFVERKDKSDRGKGLALQLRERMQKTHNKEERPIAVFAEGTTTNGDYILPFKSGAFLAKLPVTLVVIQYGSNRVSPAWESISGFRHLLLMLCEPRHTASVSAVDLHPGENESHQDFNERARKAIAEIGNFKPSASTFKDKLEYHKELRKSV